MCRPSDSCWMPRRPATRSRLIRWSYWRSPWRSMMTSAVPPATGRPSCGCCSSNDRACARLVGAWKVKSRTSALHFTGRRDDRLHDLVVAGAAAQIAHHPVLDVLLVGRWVLVQQRPGRDDLPGRADATLETAVFDETSLERVKPVLASDAL